MDIAVVGAGAAGLAAARRLAGRGHDVVIFEAAAGPGGRAATLRAHGCAVDHGAQYLKTPDDLPDVRRLVLDDLPRDDLLDIGRPVWVFDRNGRIEPGDPAQNADPKWTYRDGLDTLGRLLSTGLRAQWNSAVARLDRRNDRYRLFGRDNRLLGEADRVLVAIPSGRAIELLSQSAVRPARRDAALAELAKARYRALISVVLGFAAPPEGTVFAGGTPPDPRPYYALVNADRGHDMSWLAVENDKGARRVPAGTLALVAQMGAAWSAAHLEALEGEVAAYVAGAACALLGCELGRPRWHDVTRWREALPDTTCDPGILNRDHDGLLFAGDYVAGGRVHLALQAGLALTSSDEW